MKNFSYVIILACTYIQPPLPENIYKLIMIKQFPVVQALTLKPPWVINWEFLLTASMQY